MNKVILLGYLSKDPIPRTIPEKNMILSKFSIAVSDARDYNKNYFINCVAWSQTADYINNHLKKGDFVFLEGRLTNQSYTNAEGAKVYSTEIVVDNIKNLGSRKAKTNETEKVNIDDYLEKKVDLNLEPSSSNAKTKSPETKGDVESNIIDWDEE